MAYTERSHLHEHQEATTMYDSTRTILPRDLDRARQAYTAQDVKLSVAAHDMLISHTRAPEHHAIGEGHSVKALVFGGLDGIVTTFAVVCAVAGASLNPKLVIIFGVSNMISDALSMGLGDYLSELAEIAYVENERKRESWEVENCPEGEKHEMVELYTSKGISEDDAEFVVNTLFKYKEFFIDHMMVVELGLMPPDSKNAALKSGLTTFVAFVVFGSVPLLAYTRCLFGVHFGSDRVNVLFTTSVFLTAVTMFLLGVTKAQFTNQNKLESGIIMLMNGIIAAGFAYLIGWSLQEALGISSA